MLVGRIRELQVREITAVSDTVQGAREKVEAQVPDGWVLTDAPVHMAKASTTVTCDGRISMRGTVQEIEAEDMAGIEAAVPDGWQLLSVREG